jgi:phenylpyruvate tautomerase PptA (4-oxalocrotonate tautomerase family)
MSSSSSGSANPSSKRRLADDVTKAVMSTLNYGEQSVSVGIEEVKPPDWTDQVYNPDIGVRPLAVDDGWRGTEPMAGLQFPARLRTIAPQGHCP